ncbi:WD repeat-containing protein WRAP73-like [Littorina saxatilis]|uniref:WD repeat-containing protein WRAP73-like n=1 Tax=Littorina saxatilis TaxID=31220 RepID=UPI0038B5B691
MNKANPKVGVSMVAFSADCKYMYTKNDNMPTVLWIWDVRRLTQCAVLIQASNIKCVQWDPQKPRLALCTGTNKLYMWSPEGSLCVDVPAEASFQVMALQWQPDGGSLLLLGRDQMCVCFLTTPGDGNDSTAHTTITTNNLTNSVSAPAAAT